MGPIPLSFDVSLALGAELTGGQSIAISGWLFFPDDPAELGERPVTMTLLGGGSYDKRYHHAVIPSHSGYSAAEHLAALGNVVLLADHLGVGESSRLPLQQQATKEVCALAMHTAVTQFHERLARGDLDPKLPAIANPLKIGGGHSMGAMLATVQQGNHRTFEALMIMGYTTQGVHFYHGPTRVRAGDFVPPDGLVDYSENARGDQRYNFYWDDVPPDVIAYDDTTAAATPTKIGYDSIRVDIIKPEAARIDVPVFFGNSERDVSEDPRAEAAFFPLCKDFSLYLLPRAAHCQTFAGTRHLFWNRMHDWSRMVLRTLG